MPVTMTTKKHQIDAFESDLCGSIYKAIIEWEDLDEDDAEWSGTLAGVVSQILNEEILIMQEGYSKGYSQNAMMERSVLSSLLTVFLSTNKEHFDLNDVTSVVFMDENSIVVISNKVGSES